MSKKPLADIHTHILPGVDDGADDVFSAITMLKNEAEMGTRLVVLTPHYSHRRSNCGGADDLRLRYESLCREPEVERLGLRLILGSELFYSQGLSKDLKEGNALPLGNTDHVLLEFPIKSSMRAIEDGCRDIYNSGYRIILAHIERYVNLDSSGLEALFKMDVQMQMNASFVRDLCRPVFGAKRWFKSLLREGLISYIASDAHNLTTRAPELYASLIEKSFPDYADTMLYGNAEKLFRL